MISLRDLWPFQRKGVEEAQTPYGRVIGYAINGSLGSRDRDVIYSAVALACLRVLCNSVSILPIKIHREGDKTKADNSDNALWRVLNRRPNPYQTPAVFKAQMLLHMIVKGNWYAYINRVGKNVVDLVPMDPDQIEVKQLRDHSLLYTWRNGEDTKTFLPSDVLHVQGMVYDGRVGLALKEAAKKILKLDHAMQEHASTFFENQAVPGQIVLSTEQNLKQEQVDDMRKRMETDYSGSNRGRPLILFGGLKAETLAVSAEDAQLIEQQKHLAIQFCGMIGVPPHMIGILDRATFSNIEQQSIEFVTHGLLPHMVRIEEEINLKALGIESGFFVKFNEKALLRGDSKTQAEVLRIMRQNGIISANEWRDMLDMSPRAGGDDYWTPVNVGGSPDAQPASDNGSSKP